MLQECSFWSSVPQNAKSFLILNQNISSRVEPTQTLSGCKNTRYLDSTRGQIWIITKLEAVSICNCLTEVHDHDFPKKESRPACQILTEHNVMNQEYVRT